ncbi:MAG: hypothetical protein CMA92_05165 [Euryarchaeota archaeon]|nr:hypothetical protein [Euryarchaeota archaeon]
MDFFDLFRLKQKALDGDDESRDDPKTVFLMIFEKVSILFILLIILAIAVALELPSWGVALVVGLSVGPVVYGHYYFIYIRPVLKQQEGSSVREG